MEPETTKVVIDLAMQTGAIVGLTSLVAKMPWPNAWRDIILPVAASIIGVAVVVLPMYFDIAPVFQGIILGGSVTGLYGAAKDIRKTPQVVVNE